MQLLDSVAGDIFGHQFPGGLNSHRLHVSIFRFFFVNLSYTSIDSVKMMANFPEGLELEAVISQTKLVHLQLVVDSPYASSTTH